MHFTDSKRTIGITQNVLNSEYTVNNHKRISSSNPRGGSKEKERELSLNTKDSGVKSKYTESMKKYDL